MSFDTKNDPLIPFLLATRGKKVCCLMQVGNRGDGLIHKGWWELCVRLGITTKEFYFPEQVEGELLLVHGAGALGKTYNFAIKELRFYEKFFKQIAVLPSTIDTEDSDVRSWVKSLDERYTVFTRESESLRRVQAANATFKNVFLSQDLAFHSDLSEWAKHPHEGIGICFRTDHESGGYTCAHSSKNIDISVGPSGEVNELLNYVASKSTIYTDRTHVGIAGAMMGRTVHFFPNAYFKNQAIYENSLRHLSHVTFHTKSKSTLAKFLRLCCNRTRTLPSRLRHWIWLKRRIQKANHTRIAP